MLPFCVFAAIHLRSVSSFPRLCDLRDFCVEIPLSFDSRCYTSPNTSVKLAQKNSFQISALRTLSFSVSRKSCICHSYENCRVCTNNSHSGTSESPIIPRLNTQVLSFHTLAHSFALIKSSTLLFSIASALFAQNTRGVGYPPAHSAQIRRIVRTSRTTFSYLGIGTMRRRLIRIALILLFFPLLLAAAAGWLAAPAFQHPIRREMTPDLIREADASLAVTGAAREDFDVRAPDGALLRGWKVRPRNPNRSWVLLFHGVADNRVGVIGQSEFLLRAGYSVVMMDARAHGASGGPIATYGWLERNDTRAIIDALLSSEHVGAGLAPPAFSFVSFTSSTSSTSLTSSF